MKIRIISAVVSVLCIVSIVVLTNKMLSVGKNDSDGIQTVTILSPWKQNETNGKALKTLVSGFNAKYEEKYRVKILNHAQNKYYSNLRTDFVSGCSPDIVLMSPYCNIKEYINDGYLIPVSKAYDGYQKLISRLDKSFLSQISYEDELYALPYELNMYVMYYNRDLFAKCGIDCPQNYEELKKAINTFREKSIVPVAANIGGIGSKVFEYILIDYMKDFELTEKNTNSFLSSVEKMKELYNIGAFPDNMFTATDYEVRNLFKNKQAAMLVDDLSFCAELNSDIIEKSKASGENILYDDMTDMSYFPKITDDDWFSNALIYEMSNGTLFFTKNIEEDSDKKQVVSAFLEYMYDKKNIEEFFSRTFTISAAKEIWPSSYTTDYMIKAFDMRKSTYRYCNSPLMYIRDDNWNLIVMKNMPNMLVDKVDPVEIWRKLSNENK